jgi:restriction system protein
MNKWTLETLLELDPQEFENLLAHLFRKMEYVVEETQYSRDGGIDLIIRINKFGLSHSWIVQAKRYSHPVGVKEVREYSSLKYRDRVDGVIIVTTSAFTKDGYEEAAQHNVKLIEGHLLVEMLNHYLPENENAHHENKDERLNADDVDAGTILKQGEEILLTEYVNMGKERFSMMVTNKNIFFKRETNKMFSRKKQVELIIEVKDILGVHREQNILFLLSGKKNGGKNIGKNIDIYPISSKKMIKLLEVMASLRPAYVRGEHLILSTRKDTLLTVLTSKRLIKIDIPSKKSDEISIANIVSVENNASLFKKNKIEIIESANGMKKHSLEVNDARMWKHEIEQIVRIS